MSDAPERMWVDPHTHLAYSDDHGDGHPLYIRADIHEAEVARLREALRDLVDEASEAWVALDRYGDAGRFVNHDDGATFRARRALGDE